MPDDDFDIDVPQFGQAGAAATVVVLAILAVLIWYVRPWFQDLVYAIYTTPVLLVAVLLAVAVVALGSRINRGYAINAGIVVFVVVLFGGATLAGLFAGETLGKATMSEAETVDGLAESDAEEPRIVTKSVADRYASNTLNFPQYRVTKSEITMRNGTPHWSYALAPDGLWNHFTKKQHGTVLVDMTRQNAEVETVEDDLSKGIGTAFYNHYQWQTLKRSHYLVDYQDPYMVVHEDEQYIAVPYTKPEFHWGPVPHTTPTWGGVALVDNEGNVEDLSPQEARNHEVLDGQKLYPFSLTRQRVARTEYRNGIVNTFTSHEGQIEVAPVPGSNNDQPFLVMTEDGIKYIVAVEPYGDAQGLREVWTIDGRTGEYDRFAVDDSLFGPRKATDFVRQAARTTDWNRFDPSEPIPVVIDGQFYWKVRVVPTDSSGISYIAFVNAQTSDVAEVEETDQVVAFMEGQQPAVTDSDDPTQREPAMVVQRVAPNGTVIGEIEIYDNETISVVQGNQTDN
jgi:hypothetical protein